MGKGLVNNETQYLLIFDIGTTAVKTIIFDTLGTIIEKAYQEYPTKTPSPGIVEQNPEDWWLATKASTKKALNSSKIEPKAIAGIGVTTQRATVTPMAKNGEVLYPAMTWMDARSCSSADTMTQKYPQRNTAVKILWLKDNLPRIFKKAFKFATVDTYIYHKLTGHFVSDFTNSAYGPFDIHRLEWSDEILEEAKIPLEKLPSLLPAGSTAGELSSRAAREIGLKAGVLVVVGGGDQQCSTIGLNATSPGIVKATTGTGTFLDAQLDTPLFDLYDPLTRTFCIPHVIPDKWVFEAALPGTGLMYRWFRDQFCPNEIQTASSIGIDSYDIINLEAASVQPGSQGLIIIPLFMFARGTMWGLSFSHTKAHIARAILESAGYGLNFFIEVMNGQNIEVKELRIDGGGAKSHLWRQIQSDITEKPVVLTSVAEDASALGAAILVSYGIGLRKSISGATEKMVKVVEKMTPIQENSQIYDQIYPKFAEIFLQIAMEIQI
jgi:xylulokinase